ncbi:MAG TPA: hypothetical protein VFM25_01965 [Verrucomicrobiae bacterium]|nr:hypothetical protein [Verrucomicrobiae bacterium]
MLPEELQYPAAYYGGQACFYKRAAKFSNSYFGGPPHSTFKFTGITYDTHSIHHVMSLSWKTVPGIEKKGISDLPLFYGLRYGACRMKYEILPPSESVFSKIEDSLSSKSGSIDLPDLSSECHLLEMEPRKSSDSWPYAGYPELLPYVPLCLADRVACSPEDFQSLILHGDDVNPEEVTVVIPPMFDIGISLFGHDADAEGIQLVFRCNLENKKLTVNI